ncbi:hypothetical protein AB0J28_21780 [Streptosporangium canum]|uniref:hypothetical protein n=1 Tax=Streptosporangium canum TaxID=324952 RepID=UPI003449DE5D
MLVRASGVCLIFHAAVLSRTDSSGSTSPAISLFASDADQKDVRDVLRTDDSRYAIRTSRGTTVLDLARGPLADTVPATGWCKVDDEVDLGTRRGTSGPTTTQGWYPYSPDGHEVETPSSAPDFAGARVGRRFIWQERTGGIRAALM